MCRESPFWFCTPPRALAGAWLCLYELQIPSPRLDGEVGSAGTRLCSGGCRAGRTQFRQLGESQLCDPRQVSYNCSELQFLYWERRRKIWQSYDVVEKLNYDKTHTVPGVVSGLGSNAPAGFDAFIITLERAVFSELADLGQAPFLPLSKALSVPWSPHP